MDPILANVFKQTWLFLTLVYKVGLAYGQAIGSLLLPARRKSIRNKSVLITGAGHGLGRELAFKFAGQGVASVILVDINEQNNEQVRQEIQSKFPQVKVIAFAVDIRVEENVRKLAEKLEQTIGRKSIDILVNNAGIVQCLPFLSLSPAMIERTFQVNVLAHMWTIKHFLPAMLKQKSGHIVGISSIAGLIGGKYLTDYCASKFAVVGLMESLDRELHDDEDNREIHLTTVCPTCMNTGMFQTFTSKFAWLLPVLNAEQVADCILDAILTNQTFAAIPPITLFFHRLSYLLPARVSLLVQNYLNYGVKPHSDVAKAS